MISKNIATLTLALATISLILFIKNAQNNQNLTKDPPKTVEYVDINQYLGLWYEQASLPFYFTRNCERTTATYSLNTDKTIKVDNACYRNNVKQQSIGKAFVDPSDTTKSNAKLKVEFSTTLDIKGNYWIVRLAKDYSYSVVSSPNYAYLWILSRQSILPEKVYDSIVASLKNDGFPVQKLKKTVQV